MIAVYIRWSTWVIRYRSMFHFQARFSKELSIKGMHCFQDARVLRQLKAPGEHCGSANTGRTNVCTEWCWVAFLFFFLFFLRCSETSESDGQMNARKGSCDAPMSVLSDKKYKSWWQWFIPAGVLQAEK